MDKTNLKSSKEELIKENDFLRKRVVNLEGAEDRYRTLIELGKKIGEAVIMLQDIDNKEGVHVYASDQWLAITGYSKKELLGMSFFDIVCQQDKDISISRHRQKMSGEAIPDLFELSIIRQNGKVIPIEITSGVTKYQGKLTNVVYIRDISERKQAERLLEKERDRYIILLEHVPIAIWEQDFSEGMPFIDKLRASGVTDFEKYFGEHLDDFAYFVSLQKMIRTNPASLKIYDIDPMWKTIRNRYNNPVRELGNINNENEFLFFKGIIKPFSQMIEGRSEILVKEYPIPTTDGKPKYVRASFSVAPGHEHDLSLVFGAGIDITDRIKAETELLEYKDQLEQIISERTAKLSEAEAKAKQALENEIVLRHNLQEQIEERTQFTRALVHELKTPLTPLLSASEYLAGHLKEETSREFAQNIYNGAKRLENRIGEMMDVARGELGLLQLNIEEGNLLQIIEDAVKYYMPQALKKDQLITITPTGDNPSIKIDKDKIHQVIINLLDNASRYTKMGGEIFLSTKVNDGNAFVEIMDKGSGIYKELQPNLFRLHKSVDRKEQYSGLGLGLVLCKIFIELHGGNIWIKSTKGKGTTVSFSIPLNASSKPLKMQR